MRRYEVLLSAVVCDAWRDWSEVGRLAPVQRGRLGRSARALDLRDFMLEHAKRRFAAMRGVTLTLPHGRPMLVLAGGLVQARFKKLSRYRGVVRLAGACS